MNQTLKYISFSFFMVIYTKIRYVILTKTDPGDSVPRTARLETLQHNWVQDTVQCEQQLLKYN